MEAGVRQNLLKKKAAEMIAPRKVVLVYDGDCGFCRFWVARWKRVTEDRVDYAPYQEAGGRFPEISPERFARSIQLIEPAGMATEGAEAAFRALAYNPSWRGPLWAYNHIPGVRAAAEGVYRWVARRRTYLSKIVG